MTPAQASWTGTVRKIDMLGRIVLPAEMRELLGIVTGDALDIHVEDGRLVVTKLTPACALCGSERRLTAFADRHVCAVCVNDVHKLGPPDKGRRR